MTERPILDKTLDSKTFRDFYYLKEELVDFCRKNNLPVSGGKIELTERIANFLDTGEITISKTVKKKVVTISNITLDTRIEENFICSEKHRAFFKENIGKKDIDKLTSEKFHISIAAAAQFRVKHGFKKNPKKIECSLREQLEEIERRELKFMEKEREPKHNYFTFDTKNLFK